jgi:hypothetical protein
MSTFPLPKTSYDILKRTITAYLNFGTDATIQEIGDFSLGEAPFSKNHGFLMAHGIITKGRYKKRLTDDIGQKLGAALEHNVEEDIKKYWRDIVVNDNDFLMLLVNKIHSKGEMSRKELSEIIVYLAQPEKQYGDAQSGIYAILEILVKSGLVKYENRKYKVDESIQSTPEEITNLVFVIMAIRNDMDPVFKGIESAAKQFNLSAKRVIDVPGDYRITEKIISMIQSAKFIVADLTHERPNVYFELGFARGKNKTVITIAKEGTPVHFDVKDWTYIPYSDSRIVESELIKRFEYELSK